MILTLQVTEKEAVMLHMLYGLGAKLVARDPAEHIAAYAQNINECLARNFSHKEKKALSAKLSKMGNEVSLETLRQLGVVNYNV